MACQLEAERIGRGPNNGHDNSPSLPVTVPPVTAVLKVLAHIASSTEGSSVISLHNPHFTPSQEVLSFALECILGSDGSPAQRQGDSQSTENREFPGSPVVWLHAFTKILPGDFPGGPVVKTMHFHCRRHGFHP